MRGTGYRRLWLRVISAAVVFGAGTGQVASAQDDQEALLGRLRELMKGAGYTRLAMPLPGSRSVILVADVSAPMYFFFERGSIRGSAIDTFYAAYEAGDVDAAFEAFRSSALPTARVTDYGWNGLGVPMETQSGNEIGDILYRSVEGVFRRAPAILADDVAKYVEALRSVIAVLEQGRREDSELALATGTYPEGRSGDTLP